MKINRRGQKCDAYLFLRDLKKPKFIADNQAKFDIVFDIAKSPEKVAPVVVATSTNQNQENKDDSTVNAFLVSPLK